MTDFRSTFLQRVSERGYVHQCTDFADLDRLLADEAPVGAYIGFDCTAPGLHVASCRSCSSGIFSGPAIGRSC